MKNITIGSNVKLAESMMRHADFPEKYSAGIVTRIGSWGIVDVKWNGIDHEIGMREDEIEAI